MTSARRKSFISMVIATILFIFGITAGMSFAYFSDTKTATNTLSFGKLKIALSDTVGSSTQETITLTPNASGGNNLLAVNDTITLTGSIGLEENSVPAYIRVKVELYETSSTSSTTETKVSAPAFVSGFLSQMSTIKDGDKQWFVVGNYLYLGNKLEAGTTNDFTYSTSNTTATSNATNANKVTITDEMLTGTLKGKSVKVKLIYQAIQASGALASNVTLGTGYLSDNATKISKSELWGQLFAENPGLAAIYNGDYYNGYVRGNFKDSATINGTTYQKTSAKTSYDVYTDTLTSEKGAMSPFAFFQPSTDNTGSYVAFGWYPQTIKSSTVTVSDTAEYEFNGKNYYVGSDDCLYEKKTRSSERSGCSYSNDTAISNEDYYFKLEPIIWRVLDESSGLLHSVSALTAMVYYQDTNSSRTIGGKGRGVNNYEYSYIRAYLNGYDSYGPGVDAKNGTTSDYYYYNKGFMQCAFTDNQKALQTSNKWLKGSIVQDELTSNSINTEDYVFILSKNDLEKEGMTNALRVRFPTDYAMACGSSKGNNNYGYGSWYFTRTIDTVFTSQLYGVRGNGFIGDEVSVNLSSSGLVPALFLNMS